MAASSKLFKPLRVGSITLQHRIVMSPMTRLRTDDDHVPLDMVVDYYAQRAAVPGTLLVTEGTFPSLWAGGYANVPGIYTDAQIAAWKKVTDAVHAKGSYIALQLGSIGRPSSVDVLRSEGGNDLVSASDIPLDDQHPKPRPLNEDEIQAFVDDHARAAKDAIGRAGFDFVEIHAAFGYLIDQFTQTNSNKRTDKFGGSIENRARFALEVAGAVTDAVGADKVGMRLSPLSTLHGMGMDDYAQQFGYLIRKLADLKLAFLDLTHEAHSEQRKFTTTEWLSKLDFAIKAFDKAGVIFLNGGLTADSAYQAVDEIFADQDIVAMFGRPFIANPDLPYRIKHSIALTEPRKELFYAKGAVDGYLNYPFSEKFLQEGKA